MKITYSKMKNEEIYIFFSQLKLHKSSTFIYMINITYKYLSIKNFIEIYLTSFFTCYEKIWNWAQQAHGIVKRLGVPQILSVFPLTTHQRLILQCQEKNYFFFLPERFVYQFQFQIVSKSTFFPIFIYVFSKSMVLTRKI